MKKILIIISTVLLVFISSTYAQAQDLSISVVSVPESDVTIGTTVVHNISVFTERTSITDVWISGNVSPELLLSGPIGVDTSGLSGGCTIEGTIFYCRVQIAKDRPAVIHVPTKINNTCSSYIRQYFRAWYALDENSVVMDDTVITIVKPQSCVYIPIIKRPIVTPQ